MTPGGPGSVTGLQVKAALRGRLTQEIEAASDRVGSALTQALFEAADDLKSKLRQDVIQSGLASGARVSRTWRTSYYPNRRYVGLNPAALIYSSWPKVVAAFESGGVIQARQSSWLLIPNPVVWGRIPRPRGAQGGPAPSLYRLAVSRFGPLDFVPLPSRGNSPRALLVTELRRGRGKRGGYRRVSDAARRRGDFEQVAVFFLVKATRLPRLLRGATIRARAEASAANDVERRYIRNINRPPGQALLAAPVSD